VICPLLPKSETLTFNNAVSARDGAVAEKKRRCPKTAALGLFGGYYRRVGNGLNQQPHPQPLLLPHPQPQSFCELMLLQPQQLNNRIRMMIQQQLLPPKFIPHIMKSSL